MKFTNFDDEIEKGEPIFSFNWIDTILILGAALVFISILIKII